MSQIPLVDLRQQHLQIAGEVEQGLAQLFADADFIQGKAVAEFERDFAQFSGTRHCIGVANGTDALEIILRALEVGHGDEVLVPANTFAATALAVVRSGASPVFVDCDPTFHLMTTAAAEGRLTGKTKAIIAVHLYGQMAPLEELKPLAERAGVALIEDAAQAQGATRLGQGCGAFGVAAGVSFYPGKNLGAYGDAGAVLTNSDAIAHSVRVLRNYGSEQKYHHPRAGFNSRLDTIQAVVLNAKLKRLAAWNEARRQAAARYHSLLAGLDDVILPRAMAGNEHVWHLYVVRVPHRDEVLERLNRAGIGALVHYPLPLHLQGAFGHLKHRRGDFPATEAAAASILSLPLFPEITVEQQERVVAGLKTALR